MEILEIYQERANELFEELSRETDPKRRREIDAEIQKYGELYSSLSKQIDGLDFEQRKYEDSKKEKTKYLIKDGVGYAVDLAGKIAPVAILAGLGAYAATQERDGIIACPKAFQLMAQAIPKPKL